MIIYFEEAVRNYLITLVPLMLLEGIIYVFEKKHYRIQQKAGYLILWQVFALYLTMVFSVTGTPGVLEAGQYREVWFSPSHINLQPFSSPEMSGLVLNVFMFVPLGILLPLLWNAGFFRTMTAGAMLSLMIEISQLFNMRATDIDDLLMNTLGAVIGYLVYAICLRWFIPAENRVRRRRTGPEVQIILLFLFHFFIASTMISGYWNLQ